MRTIRTNCFETNSSSTHSITIETNESILTTDFDQLVDERNFLIPVNLNDAIVKKAISEYDDSTWTTRCKTRNAKAAMLVHYVVSWYDQHEPWVNGKRVPYDMSPILEVIAHECGYAGVKWDEKSWSYYSIDEHDCDEDFTLTEVLGRNMKGYVMIDVDGLRKFIADIVLDPTKEITDTNESH